MLGTGAVLAAVACAGCGGGSSALPPRTTVSTTTGAATSTARATVAGNTEQGKVIFLSNSCAGCHTFDAAGTTARIGPDLDDAPPGDARKAGMSLPAFVRQSIVEPNSYVSPGFQKGLMPQDFGELFSSRQLDDLVAFLVNDETSG